MIKSIKTTLKWFKDGLFPIKCVICGRGHLVVCEKHDTFPPAPKSHAEFQYIDSCYAVTAQQDVSVQKMIKYYKYEGWKELAPVFAQSMSQYVSFDENKVLISMPLHWRRFLWRGYNQADLLAKQVARITGIPLLSGVKRIKYTSQQARLSREKRLQNTKNIFVWKGPSLKGRSVVIIDDVVASGATLDEAAKILKKAGALQVTGLVFARGGE